MSTIVSMTEIVIISLIYAVFTLSAIYLILKNEKGWSMPLWIIVIMLAPFLGPVIYYVKHFTERRPRRFELRR